MSKAPHLPVSIDKKTQNDKKEETILIVGVTEKQDMKVSGTIEGFSWLYGLFGSLYQLPSKLPSYQTTLIAGSVLFVACLGWSSLISTPKKHKEEERLAERAKRDLFLLLNLAADQLAIMEKYYSNKRKAKGFSPEYDATFAIHMHEKLRAATQKESFKYRRYTQAYDRFYNCVNHLRAALYSSGAAGEHKQQDFAELVRKYYEHRKHKPNLVHDYAPIADKGWHEHELWSGWGEKIDDSDEPAKAAPTPPPCSRNEANNLFTEKFTYEEIKADLEARYNENYEKYRPAWEYVMRHIDRWIAQHSENRYLHTYLKDLKNYLMPIYNAPKKIEAKKGLNYKQAQEHVSEYLIYWDSIHSDDADLAKYLQEIILSLQLMQNFNDEYTFWEDSKLRMNLVDVFGTRENPNKKFLAFIQDYPHFKTLIPARGEKITWGASIATFLFEAVTLGLGTKAIIQSLVQAEIMSSLIQYYGGIFGGALLIDFSFVFYSVHCYRYYAKQHNDRKVLATALKQARTSAVGYLYPQLITVVAHLPKKENAAVLKIEDANPHQLVANRDKLKTFTAKDWRVIAKKPEVKPQIVATTSETLLAVSQTEKRDMRIFGAIQGLWLSGIFSASYQFLSEIPSYEITIVGGLAFLIGSLIYSNFVNFPREFQAERGVAEQIKRELFLLLNLAVQQLAIMEQHYPPQRRAQNSPEYDIEYAIQMHGTLQTTRELATKQLSGGSHSNGTADRKKAPATERKAHQIHIEIGGADHKTAPASSGKNIPQAYAEAYDQFYFCIDRIRTALCGADNVQEYKQQQFVQLVRAYFSHLRSNVGSPEQQLWANWSSERPYEEKATAGAAHAHTHVKLRGSSDNNYANLLVEKTDFKEMTDDWARRRLENYQTYQVAWKYVIEHVQDDLVKTQPLNSQARPYFEKIKNLLIGICRAEEKQEIQFPATMLQEAYNCVANHAFYLDPSSALHEPYLQYFPQILLSLQVMIDLKYENFLWGNSNLHLHLKDVFGAQDSWCSSTCRKAEQKANQGSFLQFVEHYPHFNDLMQRKGDKVSFISDLIPIFGLELFSLLLSTKVILQTMAQAEQVSLTDYYGGIPIGAVIINIMLATYNTYLRRNYLQNQNDRKSLADALKHERTSAISYLYRQSSTVVARFFNSTNTATTVKDTKRNDLVKTVKEQLRSASGIDWKMMAFKEEPSELVAVPAEPEYVPPEDAATLGLA